MKGSAVLLCVLHVCCGKSIWEEVYILDAHSSASKPQRGTFSAFLEADAHGFSPAVDTPCAAGSKEHNRFE